MKVYLGKDDKGFRIPPGCVKVIGFECYIRGICNEIDKAWWSSMMGFASRCVIRVKAKHHIKRLQAIFPGMITEEKVAQGLAIKLPTFWNGPKSDSGWTPENSIHWTELTRAWSNDWRAVLGLGKGTVTYEEARTAFRNKIKETHPDAGGSSGETHRVLKAWKFAKVYFGK